MTIMQMVPETSDDPIVSKVFNRLKQRWGMVLNLYRILAWSPELAQSWAAFAWSLRFETTVSRKLRELLVIRVAALLGAQYEYKHHLQMAKDEGVTEEQVAALSEWQSSRLFNNMEKAVLTLADDLALKSGATAETMFALHSTFSNRDVIELLVTGSFYCGVARIVNSLQLELEANHAELKPRNY